MLAVRVTACRPHVGNVDFTIKSPMMDFLPVRRKQVLPCSMPFGLALPPTVADSGAHMSPVMQALGAALAALWSSCHKIPLTADAIS
jgi:hypothetical protein